MNISFYITNHGFGHASRNVPIIKRLIDDYHASVFIKSDKPRCEFLHRNLTEYDSKIEYYGDVNENGLILKPGQMTADLDTMKEIILSDFPNWDSYIQHEISFLSQKKIDVVVCDTMAWPLDAAKKLGIKSILIGNFNWAQVYKGYYGAEIWQPYVDCYKKADLALWYELADIHELGTHNDNFMKLSLVSRPVNEKTVEQIKTAYDKPIVFVSLGASAELNRPIDVSSLPYDFVITRGLELVGPNVHVLPMDMTNTPDYIAAAKYVIAKGGWSTISEILLQHKTSALLMRGDNNEDNHNKEVLEKRQQAVIINGDELDNISDILASIDELSPDSFDMYINDCERICSIIVE